MKLNIIRNPVRLAAVWLLFFLMPSFAVAQTDDFATIEANLLQATSEAAIPTQAQVTDAMTITITGLYADIDYIKSGETYAQKRMGHFRRLIILGLAYRHASSSIYPQTSAGDSISYSQTSTAISTAIINGLKAWVAFFPPTSTYGTAFNDGVVWAPGTYPNSYGEVVLLVKDLVKTNTIAPKLWDDSITYLTQYYHKPNHFAANGQAPYRAALIGHVLARDSANAAKLTADFMQTELNYTSRENDVWATSTDKFDLVEGFHPDYSFQQHSGGGRTNYWGHYGAGFIRNMPALLRLTSGTAYTLKSRIPFITDAIVNGFQWHYYAYESLDLQATGRWYQTVGTIADNLIAFKELAAIAGAEGDTKSQAALTEVVSRLVSKNPTTLRGDRMFWRADYHVHRADGWGTTVRMSSRRSVACESDGKSMGMNNHYTGSGALYLVQTGYEYKGVVSGETPATTSPNWNWRRLPGITVEQYPATTALPDHIWGKDSLGGTTFAGGASDGTYGVVGYKHYYADCTGSQPVTAHKAAFFFENQYVMAGAGITQTGGSYPVVTTINQTRLLANTSGSVISYSANGVTTSLPLSTTTTPTLFPSGGAWVLSGNTGYVFPVGGGTYSFQQLYTSASATPTKQDLFWLGIDHGQNPSNASYWCIVRPNSNETDLTNYLANPDVVAAANTQDAQGVFGPKQVFQAIYYTDTGGTISGSSWLRSVTVDKPCALILRPDSITSATKLMLTLSNPQCESVDIPTVTVTIRTAYNISGSLNNGDGTYTLTRSVDLPYIPGYKGKSIVTELPLVTTPAPVITSSPTATAKSGQPFSYKITGNNSPASYSAVGLPAGLVLTTSTGIISGTLTTPGTYAATIGATNAGGSGSAGLAITVLPPAPVITSGSSAIAIVGQPFTYQITGDNTPTGYSANGLPAGLVVNTSTGVISGTPTSLAGTYTATILAVNAGGAGSASLAITVTMPITDLESVPPTLTLEGGSALLRMENSVIGHWYQLQRTTELSSSTVWQNIGTPQVGTNGVLILSDPSGMTGPRVFYRIKISVTAQ